MTGRPREPQVPRSERVCAKGKHGTTTHSGHLDARSGSLIWRCMACNVERQHDYLERVRSGERVPEAPTPKPAPRPVCEHCGMEIPLSGECGWC